MIFIKIINVFIKLRNLFINLPTSTKKSFPLYSMLKNYFALKVNKFRKDLNICMLI